MLLGNFEDPGNFTEDLEPQSHREVISEEGWKMSSENVRELHSH